jgi:hypothetical protein
MLRPLDPLPSPTPSLPADHGSGNPDDDAVDAEALPEELEGVDPGGGDGAGLAGTEGPAGDGTGSGAPGTGGRGRRPPELFGRVIGSGLRRGTPIRADLPFVSLKEATALRMEDHFPRLPAALWPERGPYLVALQVCVTAEGRVSDAALMSNGSPRLDPVVVQAVRGWRYRPRLHDGQPGPFCHGILIKYEITD